MEAFSLLKYWRGGGGGVTGTTTAASARTTTGSTTGTTTIATTVRQTVAETDEDDDDEGPFFDMEFTVPDEEDGEHDNDDNDETDSGEDEGENNSAGTDGEREFNFTLSSGSSADRSDPNLSLSPSDDLFFKGRLVPLESSSLACNPSEPNSKPQFPVSLLKSATKFRVFMLGFKKPKSTTTDKVEINGASPATQKQTEQQPQTQTQTQTQQQQSKFFTVKFKVEEVPIVSLFTRDNSSRISGNKISKQSSDEVASEEKKFAKDVVQKYLKMIKPLYFKVSKRYGEKLRFSGQLSLGLGKTAPAATSTTPISSPTKNEGEPEETEAIASNVNIVKSQKQGNLPAGLRVVCKHLGKSRSASSAVAAVPPVPFQSKRRDDSLLQQQDGIQSAILHCKRSFNASRDSSLFSRCTSDPCHEKSIDSSRSSSSSDAIDART